MKHSLALRGAALTLSALLVTAAACEEKAPPPTPTGGGGRMGSVARGVRDTVRNTEGAINDNQQQAVDAANDVQAGNASQAGKTFGLAGVDFTLQPGWSALAVTGMRKADLVYKGSTGEVHAIFYTLGGSTEDNMSRWEQQVETTGEPAKRSSQEVNGLTVHKIDIRGSYSGMSMDNTRAPAEPNSRFIGVVIEGGRG
ncbi:MAG TPA: hypothetical protein VEB22_03105, partial [Phycisphaerales bacterium]|nr:hypothetical protein [Phycisphaerales bacterium]